MRYTHAHEMHAHGVHVHEVHAYEMHAYEVHTHDMHNSAYLSPLKPRQWRNMPFLSAKSCCQYVEQYTGATANNSLYTSPIYPYSTWHCCRFASNNWHWQHPPLASPGTIC